MKNQLLKNIYYGYEAAKAEAATQDLSRWLSAQGCEADWAALRKEVEEFYTRQHSGVFGGQITLGDGYFIAGFMHHIRPRRMVEFGVASGFSSAFIVDMAAKLGLLDAAPGPFLSSYDLVRTTAEGLVVGSLFAAHYPELMPRWHLQVETTSLDLLRDNDRDQTYGNGPVLAFVDGGHAHPWPVVDLVALRRRLPHGSWVVLQDNQMMERWLADCVEYGVPCPAPVRGVNLAVAHWPGTKLIGTGICYNCAAIQLDVDDRQFERFVDACLGYRPEIPFDGWDVVVAASRAGAPAPHHSA